MDQRKGAKGWTAKVLAAFAVFCMASFGVFVWEEGPFVEPTRVVVSFDAQTDAEWLPVLSSAPIVSIKPFDSKDAYADKFIATLEGGYKTVIKLFHSTTLFPRFLPVIAFDKSPFSSLPLLDRILCTHPDDQRPDRTTERRTKERSERVQESSRGCQNLLPFISIEFSVSTESLPWQEGSYRAECCTEHGGID